MDKQDIEEAKEREKIRTEEARERHRQVQKKILDEKLKQKKLRERRIEWYGDLDAYKEMSPKEKRLYRRDSTQEEMDEYMKWGKSGKYKSHDEFLESEDYEKGGMLKGPSHKEGGIPIEVEGGEYIIRKNSVNPDTERVLKYINENGKLPKGGEYNYPTFDSKTRRKK